MPPQTIEGLVIFLFIFILVAFGRILRLKLPVWLVMMAGATIATMSGLVTGAEVYQSVNLEVIVFLFGMLTIMAAMDLSGFMEYLTLKILGIARSPSEVLAMVVFGIGLASAFLVNDSVALLGTPIMISLAKQMKTRPTWLLISLAFSITIGSMFTPIGNPQNLLIATGSGIQYPFLQFLVYLLIPTLLNLGLTYLILKFYYRRELRLAHFEDLKLIPEEAVKDKKLARLSVVAFGIALGGFVLVTLIQYLGMPAGADLGLAAVASSLFLYLASERRREILQRIDWGILVLFASMFILMKGLDNSGLLLELGGRLLPSSHDPENLPSIVAITTASVSLSQVMSNVPFTIFYLGTMKINGVASTNVKPWMALAGASTLAGNLTILGAASNLIILEASEIRGQTFGYFEFLKIGLIVTTVNLLVLLTYIALV